MAGRSSGSLKKCERWPKTGKPGRFVAQNSYFLKLSKNGTAQATCLAKGARLMFLAKTCGQKCGGYTSLRLIGLTLNIFGRNSAYRRPSMVSLRFIILHEQAHHSRSLGGEIARGFLVMIARIPHLHITQQGQIAYPLLYSLLIRRWHYYCWLLLIQMVFLGGFLLPTWDFSASYRYLFIPELHWYIVSRSRPIYAIYYPILWVVVVLIAEDAWRLIVYK